MRLYTVTYRAKKPEKRERCRVRRGQFIQEFLPRQKTYKKVPELAALAAQETGLFTIKPEEDKT